MNADPRPFSVPRGGFAISGEEVGTGPAVMLLHGLTATRRYVLHGSHALERAGYRVIAFDARGHGASGAPDDPDAFAYEDLTGDALAVLDALGVGRAALVGQSMGAATAVAVALAAPERVAALVLVTPAHLGAPSGDLARWDRLATGLQSGGPDGFLAALEPMTVAERYRETVRLVIGQRLARHPDPATLARALRATPRSAAFDGLEALGAVAAPTLVVGSQDDVDPDHPLSVALEWARRIPHADLVVDEPGESPLAWRGGTLSSLIARFLDPLDRW